MDENFSYCMALVRERDHERFVSALFAPGPARPGLYALYAFDLEVEGIFRRTNEQLAGEVRLQWWRDVISGTGREAAAGSPIAAALIETMDRFFIAPDLLIRTIESRRERLYEPQTSWTERVREFETADGAVFLAASNCLAPGSDLVPASLAADAGIAFGAARTILQGFAAAGDAGSIVEGRTLAFGHLERCRKQLRETASIVWPAFLPLATIRHALRNTARAGSESVQPLARWRRQWLLWRASRDLPSRL